MRKMLLSLALFAMACGGGITDIPPTQFDCNSLTPSSATVSINKGQDYKANFSSNCQSVTVVTSMASPYNPAVTLGASGSISIPRVSENMTITFTGNATGKTVASAVQLNVVTLPPPLFSIDRSKTPSTVLLNQQIVVAVNKQNVSSCTFSMTWRKSGKEYPETIAPAFNGDATSCGATFAPGSTMPLGARNATLKITALGTDGSSVNDTMTVGLQAPRIQVDSINPKTWISGCALISFYGHGNTFTTSNDVDFRGTISTGAAVNVQMTNAGMITNPGNFSNANLYTEKVCFNGHTGDKFAMYINNDGRPDSEIQSFILTTQ
ncbi:MAG: hypothetical protein NVSMB66_5760 [Candidatus Doudnabacteria bacterium]